MRPVEELIATAKSNEDFAYTLCQLINAVGYKIKDGWDWNWLEKLKGRYADAINPSLLSTALKLLTVKHSLSLQTIRDDERKISTIAPLAELTALEWLVLKNNSISNLRPLAGMTRLRDLNFHGNCVTDIAPLEKLQSLDSLHIGANPIQSLAPLQSLPNLRELYLTQNQVGALLKCKSLPSLLYLDIYGGSDEIPNFTQFPDMPSLKVIRATHVRDISGVDRFRSLTTIRSSSGTFANLDLLPRLKHLTHLDALTNQPLDLEPIKGCFALRRIQLGAPKISSLAALENLPVLHEIHIPDESECDRNVLAKLQKNLTGWSEEFELSKPTRAPCLDLRVVTQEEFDYYDTKAYGIRDGECVDGMFLAERIWLVDEIAAALKPHFEVGEGADLNMPYMGGLRRSDRLILYSLHAYESLRQIAMIVQETLCRARNDWIIYLQALIDESPDADEIPEDAQNFIIWVYPDKILATAEHANIVRKLIDF
jgi:hypothetical protein